MGEKTIAERFNSIPWHDSVLIPIAIRETGDSHEVAASLQLQERNGSVTQAEIVFHSCAFLRADLYLDAASMCGHAIGSARCQSESAWKREVSAPGFADPVLGGRGLDDYLHFNFYLCPPGGEIDILAKDFTLERKPG